MAFPIAAANSPALEAEGIWQKTSYDRWRQAKNRVFTLLVGIAFILAVGPLVSLLYTVIYNGWSRMVKDFPYFFTVSMNGVFGGMNAGGIYHAILGTLLITLWAAVISIPIGLLAAIYLVEYGKGNKLSRAITFFVDVMTGIPSIVAGLFAAAMFALIVGPAYASGIMGSIALSVLMIPTVVRGCEEMLVLVPGELREGAMALGVPKWRVITKVVIPTAFSGLVTSVLLAIARVIGETAPLLVTVGTLDRINANVFEGRMMTLPVYVYRQYSMGEATCNNAAVDCLPTINIERAWAAALVLLLVVLIINIAGRALSLWQSRKVVE